MAPIDLFDDPDNDSDQGNSLSTKDTSESLRYNEAYAQKFERQKRGEELMKLKDKYGSDYEPSESEEEFSSEDSDAEFITPEVDAAILKTLARIKKSDPKLYQSDANVFEEEETQNAAARANQQRRNNTQPDPKKKPLTLRDYQRHTLLALEGQEYDEVQFPSDQHKPTPAEEAEALREETKRAFHTIDDDGNFSTGSDHLQDLLFLRDRQPGDIEQEDEEYQRFLIEQVGSEDIQTALQLNTGSPAESIKELESNRDTRQADDEFLRAYVLGRGWIDREAKKIPKYKEVVQSKAQPLSIKYGPTGSNAGVLGKTVINDDHDEEDEEFVEKAEEFEVNYNFRFEASNPTVTTHARDTGPSARRKDDSRKLAREAVKARKEDEKRQRMEEVKRLQDLKKAEVMEKLDIIRKNAGAEDCNLDDLDLDSDFDPDSHDRRMNQVFDSGFYSKNDPDGKPVWEDEIEIDDIIPVTANDDEEHINFEPGGDAYDPSAPGKKLSKKMSRLAKKKKKRGLSQHEEDEQEDFQQPEIIHDLEGLSPEERKKKLLEALDEYHNLDFEDMIGDLRTRFKYAKVEPTDLMTPEQILLATDAELNQVIGLKKLAPYRTSSSERKLANRKKKLKELRKKLQTRIWGEATTDNQPATSQSLVKRKESTSEPPTKKRKGKKERQKLSESLVSSDAVKHKKSSLKAID